MKGKQVLSELEKDGKAAVISFACPELLEAIAAKRIDINKVLEKEMPGKTPKTKNYVVTSRRIIEETSVQCGHEIRRRDGLRFYYNGKKWEHLTDEQFNSFLSHATFALRVPEEESKFADSIDKLRRSYDLCGNWPMPKPQRGEAKMNCNNGTLIIKENGEVQFREHQANDGMMYVLPYDYDPQAEAPMFEKFLEEVCPDQADRDNLQEYCGYLFAPGLKLQKFLYLCGRTGNNGKSVFVEIIKQMCGIENVSLASLDTLCESSSNGDSARLDLEGRIVNVCTETPRKIKNAELFKTITIGEAVSARLMHTNIVRQIENPARLIFAGNDLPVFENGAGTAEQRRFLIVEFRVQIPKEKRDAKLAEKIIENEMPGILNWAIRGLQRLNVQKDFTRNENGEKMAEAFLDGSNNVMAYLHEFHLDGYKDTLLQSPDVEKFEPAVKELYGSQDSWGIGGKYKGIDTYCAWCKDEGRKPVGRKEFATRIRNAGIETRKTRDGVVFYMLRKKQNEE